MHRQRHDNPPELSAALPPLSRRHLFLVRVDCVTGVNVPSRSNHRNTYSVCTSQSVSAIKLLALVQLGFKDA